MNSKQVFAYLLYSILIAGVFFGFGFLVEPLILPPSFSAPVWPSAGFSLFVVLFWGYRYLPAVALGELCIIIKEVILNDITVDTTYLFAYSISILAVVLRAAAGAYLIKRILGKSNYYLTFQSILKLFYYGGIIPTFVSSLVTVLILHGFNILNQNMLLFDFFSWWVADSIGVFIVMPVMMALFARPRDVWSPRKSRIVLPVALSLLLMLFITNNLKKNENNRLQTSLENQIDTVFNESLIRFSNNQTLHNWVPKKQIAEEFNKLIKDYIDLLLLANKLQDIHYVIKFIQNDQKELIYESKNQPEPTNVWVASKEYKYADNIWQIDASATTEYLSKNASLEIWWLLTSGFLFISLLGGSMLLVTGHDIRTQQKVQAGIKEIETLNDILRESEERYKQLVEVQPVIFWKHVRGEPHLDFVSSEGSNLLGYSRSELVRLDVLWNRIVHPDDRNRVLEEYYQKINTGENFTLKYRAVTRSGEVLWFQDFISVRNVEDKTEVLGLKIDITAEQRQEEEFEQLAYYDILTNLPNRIKFSLCLEETIESAKNNNLFGALLYMDIDRFKMLNDSMGHYFGDKILVQITERLKSILDSKDIISRVSGDEFAVLPHSQFKDYDNIKSECLTIVKRIQDSLQQPFLIDGHSFYITLSIGICLYPFHADKVNQVLQYADIAMYAAKSQAKNSFSFFEKSMLKEVNEKLEIEKSLNEALIEHEFEIYYQPIFNGNKNVVKMEALIRWNHPKKGLLMPSLFIDAAEETGFIIELTDWVIDNVFSQIVNWQNSGKKILPVSINISLFQFKHSGLVELLAKMLERYRINPAQITIEITESVGIDDFDEALKKLLQIKKMGFILAIDDFGTGYSSLNYLTRMPIDILKLDMSFVEKIGQEDTVDTLIETIILMANMLNFDIIVEGVETDQQFEFLKNLGCSKFQGFLVSEAVKVGEIERLYL